MKPLVFGFSQGIFQEVSVLRFCTAEWLVHVRYTFQMVFGMQFGGGSLDTFSSWYEVFWIRIYDTEPNNGADSCDAFRK